MHQSYCTAWGSGCRYTHTHGRMEISFLPSHDIILIDIIWNPIWHHDDNISSIYTDRLFACKKCHRIVEFVHKTRGKRYMMPFRLTDDRPHGKHCFKDWSEDYGTMYKFNVIVKWIKY